MTIKITLLALAATMVVLWYALDNSSAMATCQQTHSYNVCLTELN